MISGNNTIQIFIKTSVGKFITLRVDENETVKKVKQMIIDMYHIPQDKKLYLIFQGQVLEDEQTLKHYKITHEKTLNLVMKSDDGLDYSYMYFVSKSFNL